jgi:hypothetical protein
LLRRMPTINIGIPTEALGLLYVQNFIKQLNRNF